MRSRAAEKSVMGTDGYASALQARRNGRARTDHSTLLRLLVDDDGCLHVDRLGPG